MHSSLTMARVKELPLACICAKGNIWRYCEPCENCLDGKHRNYFCSGCDFTDRINCLCDVQYITLFSSTLMRHVKELPLTCMKCAKGKIRRYCDPCENCLDGKHRNYYCSECDFTDQINCFCTSLCFEKLTLKEDTAE